MEESIIQFVEVLTGCKLLPLTKGQFAAVDVEDYEWLSRWKWTASNKGYAYRCSGPLESNDRKRRTIKMHRLIMLAPEGSQVDHIDGNKANNRRFNLRLASGNQNQWNRGKRRTNTSGFKGVMFRKECGKWRACITAHRSKHSLGSFTTPEAAHAAYAEAAKRLHGAFHRI